VKVLRKRKMILQQKLWLQHKDNILSMKEENKRTLFGVLLFFACKQKIGAGFYWSLVE
jgi:hypothetical protein